jgi:hypothetical protein
VSCGKDISGCVAQALWAAVEQPSGRTIQIKMYFHRMKIETDRTHSVANCKGQLISIEKDGFEIWGGHREDLTFDPGEPDNSTHANIRCSVPEHLDVIVISEFNKIRMGTFGRKWTYPKSPQELFATPGEYHLFVVVSADGMESIPNKIKFNWTGNWSTSDLSLI